MTIEPTQAAAALKPRPPAAPGARALAALLCALLAAGPTLPALAAKKARPPVPVLVVPLVALPGAPQAVAEKLWGQVVTELKTRPELLLTEVAEKGSDLGFSKNRDAADAEKAAADARMQLAKAQELSKKGKHVQAATGYLRAITLLLQKPLSIDEPGGLLLADATAQMAVARMISGNDEGGDEALADLVRRTPFAAADGRSPAGDYPPAFLRAYDAARQRVLSSPRGTLRVLAPAAAGPAALVLLDGRPLGNAPLQLTDVPSGVHVVRVERPGEAWAETVTLLGGAELLLQPRLGMMAATPAADLAAELARGQLDRPTAAKAARLGKSKGAQAVLVGTIAREGLENAGLAARSFLVLVKGERVVPLSAMALDGELLGASLEVLRLADDLVARLASPPPEPPLPLPLGTASADALEMPSVAAAPPAPEGSAGPVAVSSSELASAAGVAPSRAVLTPGAPPPPAAPAAGSAAAASTAAAQTAAVPTAAVPTAAAGPAAPAAPLAAAPAEPEAAPAGRRVAIPGAAPAPRSTAAPAASKAALAVDEDTAPKAPVTPRAPAAAAALPAPAPATSAVATPAAPAAAPARPNAVVPGSLAAATEALSGGLAPATAGAPAENPSGLANASQPAPSTRQPVIPGAAAPLAEPQGELVIPRRATRDDRDADAPAATRSRAAPVAATRMEAREASEQTVAKEPVKTKSHTVLWIVAGVLVAGGLGAGGYALYQGSRTASSGTVTASWGR